MKATWGQKRYCRKCEAHFYDMTRDVFGCPKCHVQYVAADFAVKAKSMDGRRKKTDTPKEIVAVPFDDLTSDPELATVLIDDPVGIENEDEDIDVSDVIEREEKEE